VSITTTSPKNTICLLNINSRPLRPRLRWWGPEDRSARRPRARGGGGGASRSGELAASSTASSLPACTLSSTSPPVGPSVLVVACAPLSEAGTASPSGGAAASGEVQAATVVPTVVTACSTSSEGVSAVRAMPSASLPCVASASCLHTPSVPQALSRCVGPSALRVGGGPSFGRGTFGSNQRNPGHGDPVTFLHELGLRKHAAVTRPKTRRNARLQAWTDLRNIKTTWLCHHKKSF
jgi:hypothetical protein